MDDDKMTIEVRAVPDGDVTVRSLVLGVDPVALFEASEEGITITMAGFGDEDPMKILQDLGQMLMEMTPDGD